MILHNQQQRVRFARDLLQLSQRDFARACHVTQATVCHWERNGSIHPKRMRRIEDLLAAKENAEGPSHILRVEAGKLAQLVKDALRVGASVPEPGRMGDLARRVLALCEPRIERREA